MNKYQPMLDDLQVFIDQGSLWTLIKENSNPIENPKYAINSHIKISFSDEQFKVQDCCHYGNVNVYKVAPVINEVNYIVVLEHLITA